jgi:hypothetical protein
VLGADVFVVEALGLLVGQGHHFACPIGESFKHFGMPLLADDCFLPVMAHIVHR